VEPTTTSPFTTNVGVPLTPAVAAAAASASTRARVAGACIAARKRATSSPSSRAYFS
jgi:hypothetical protein